MSSDEIPNEDVKFEANVRRVGPSSAGVTVPPELLKFLELNVGDTVEMSGYCKSKGKFIAFWKREKETTPK